ncbi:hypothetical protein ACFLZ1_03990 [Patescibacteria group bacterium]
MNKKSIVLGATAIILGGLVMGPKIAQAYQGDPSIQGPNCTAERHEAMEQAFENNDYNAWKELMSGKGRVTQVITEENFTRFAKAHELAEEGKLDEAKQIRQELGLGLGNRKGDGSGQGNKGQGMGQR